jgi:hypothetical protein
MWVSGVFVTPGGMLDVGGVQRECVERVWRAHGGRHMAISYQECRSPHRAPLSWHGRGWVFGFAVLRRSH